MENAFAPQLLTDSSPSPTHTFAGLPESLRMQLGPFDPQQVQDSKTLSIQSLQASALRLRYGNNYPRFPAHLIQHLQPQLFPASVDQRLHFPGAFRPFNLPTAQAKLFPSAFAPPLKSETGNGHESVQDISTGSYVSGYYGSETEDDSSFRSNSDREIDFLPGCESGTSKLELGRSTAASTPSPQSFSVKEEKSEGCNGKGSESMDVDSSENRSLRRGKISADPTSCPVCGIVVLVGGAEAHFFKELEKLSHITSLNREKKYIYDKYQEAQSCFGNFGPSSVEENGTAMGIDSGMPRGRWEAYQKIKSNRLSRLRIKNRKKKNGDPVCPVCNEKIQGSVENINQHVEHCLKKQSDEAEEEDEEENIDVEGDSEVYGEYEWTAGLLTTSSSSSNHHHHHHHNHHHLNNNIHQICEKDERNSNGHPDAVEDSSSRVTPLHLSDSDVNVEEEETGKESGSRTQMDESNLEKFPSPKPTTRA